jgi:hypothetical protein
MNAPERMSDEEFTQLARLLTRYCELELDQWHYWSVEMNVGTAYIELGLKKPPVPDDNVVSLTRWIEQHE